MTRSEKRRLARKDNKVMSKLYTFDECHQIARRMVKETKSEYDVRYSLCLATALSAEPYKFGKKRVCGVLTLFFDQVRALEAGTIEESEVRERAKKVGVLIQNEADTLAVYLDPTGKFKEE
jgi:hypothetical protein